MKVVWRSLQRVTSQWVCKLIPVGASGIASGHPMRSRPGSLETLVRHHTLRPEREFTSVDDWSHTANPMTKSPYGVWECHVPPKSPGVCAIPHDSMIKISMTLPSGVIIDRIPIWLQRVTQDLNISPIYEGRFWNPPKEEVYTFKYGHSKRGVQGLKIYEAHGYFVRNLFTAELMFWKLAFPVRICVLRRTRSSNMTYCQESRSWVTTLYKCEFLLPCHESF